MSGADPRGRWTPLWSNVMVYPLQSVVSPAFRAGLSEASPKVYVKPPLSARGLELGVLTIYNVFQRG